MRFDQVDVKVGSLNLIEVRGECLRSNCSWKKISEKEPGMLR